MLPSETSRRIFKYACVVSSVQHIASHRFAEVPYRMRWDEWRFSAKRAWQDHVVRWTTLGAALLYSGMTAFMLWKLIPSSLRSGVLTFHYNIYLGIDDVRAWPWIFSPLGVMLAILLGNTAFAFGIYRSDALAARALAGLTAMISIVWSISVFFLTMVNL